MAIHGLTSSQRYMNSYATSHGHRRRQNYDFVRGTNSPTYGMFQYFSERYRVRQICRSHMAAANVRHGYFGHATRGIFGVR